MGSNLADWEHSKENILPLKSGRDPAKLSQQYSTTATTDQQNKIAEGKTLFENAIRDYQGSDPLDLWVQYIDWMRQTTTTKSTEVLPLLERCTQLFVDSQVYKNDFRYFKIWIYYTDLCREPIDIFAFMESNGIGHSLSKMYEMRAFVLETRGRTAEADKVYNLGLQRCVQVELEKLKHKYSAFQHRAMQKVAQMDPQEIGKRNQSNDENDKDRAILGNLKKNPGVSRTTVRAQPPTTMLGNSDTSVPQKRKNNSFQVYVEDENSEPAPSSSVVPNWKELGSESSKYKENSDIPSKWNDIRIPQKKVRIFFTKT
eukprot:TRINITY_DN7610_c0_g1_i1.p1 TRINITY_DN7610_c0_g1~~TRINITY_DN7610_c0_g1_i1.p1  ORF type:complete len:314 (-),score=70.93 TRINITY_DN7610_c0_g1_i1:110-1051(-)